MQSQSESSFGRAVVAFSPSMLALTTGTAVNAFAQAQPAKPRQQFDIVIGAMCIGDMPLDARVVNRTIQQGNDVYEDWTLVWRVPAPPPKPPAGTRPSSSSAPSQQVPDSRPGTLKAIDAVQPKPAAKSKQAAAPAKAASVAAPPQDLVRPVIRFFRRELPNSPGRAAAS